MRVKNEKVVVPDDYVSKLLSTFEIDPPLPPQNCPQKLQALFERRELALMNEHTPSKYLNNTLGV